MGRKDRSGGIIETLASAWRRLDARVRRAHANWIAIFIGVVTLAAAVLVDLDGQPDPGEPGTPAGTGAGSGAGADAFPPAGQDGAKMPPMVMAKKESVAPAAGTEAAELRAPEDLRAGRVADAWPGWGGAGRACEAAYASVRKAEFVALIEARARQCGREPGGPAALTYSCEVSDGVYEVTLEYRSGLARDSAPLAFSAQYRGVKDIDPAKVNVTPLDPASEALCRKPAQADRRPD